MQLHIDNERRQLLRDGIYPETGIYVRALLGEKWETCDIIELDRDSLLRWLKSNDESNRLAEDVVGVLLGHGHLHTE